MAEVIQKVEHHAGPIGPKWMHSRFAVWMLALISFAESVFAPILIDPFLVGLVMAHRKQWKLYVAVSIGASVLGGICAYFLGMLFFDTFGQAIINAYGMEQQFNSMSQDIDQNGFVFVLIGGFTPVPYKLVALASGILQISFLTFVVASVIGRILRLGLVGWAAYAFSPKMLPIIQRNHFTVALVFGVVLIGFIAFRLFY